jgi:hypothetical protein
MIGNPFGAHFFHGGSLTFPLHAGHCMVILVQLVPVSWQIDQQMVLVIYWVFLETLGTMRYHGNNIMVI